MFGTSLSIYVSFSGTYTPWWKEGRNAEDHRRGPAYGSPGHKARKPGRFWFSVPKPYVTQDPMAGRAPTMCPQVISSIAGPWLALSVYIDRITQKSSIVSPTSRKISLRPTPL